MLLRGGTERRGTESLLRVVGSLLDDHAASAVVILESPEGWVVRGRVPGEGIDGGTQPLERAFSTPDLFAAAVDAARSRGTHRRAGPLEHDLRLIGRHIDTEELSDVVVVQNRDTWMVRHRDLDLGATVTEHVDRARLLVLEARAIMARGRPAEVSSSQ